MTEIKAEMHEHWLIELLGELRVVGTTRSITHFASRKTAALLAYLALQPGRSFPREVLADLFWPDATHESARHSLRMALSSLRKLFGEGLATDNQTVRLRPEAIRTDVAAFETAVREARWADAIALYRGPLLPGFYEDWIVPQQVRLADLFGLAACRWIGDATERTAALDRAARAVAVAPQHPDLLAALERLRPQPGIAVPAPYKHTARPLEPSVPSLVRPVLPLKLTRFLGRETELARLKDWLTPGSGTRVVTITGPGGSGKTRLAIELARDFAPQAPESLWFLSLSELREAPRLMDALRRVLGLMDTLESNPLELIAGVFNASPNPLLILDNAEQLVDAVGVLCTELLILAPGLRCVVTSRHRLDIEGERELPLLPLGLAEALVLFEDRAQVARADFAITPANRASVVELCQRLDGLPLALEIAASRVSILSPAQLLIRIGECLDFYSRQQRTVRHRSLRAAILASYELLTERLQRIFAQLTVFRNGWTLEDAQFVLGESALQDDLEALRAHSLLHYVSSPDALRVRFGMLETLATFAREQLTESEVEALEQRHADYFFSFGVSAGPVMARVTPEWRARCTESDENIKATLDYLRKTNPEKAAILVLEIAPFWFGINLLAEGQRQLEACLSQEVGLPDNVKGALRQTLGYFAEELGDLPRARALLEEALSLLRPYHDDLFRGWALHNLGTTLIRSAAYAEAEQSATEALAFWEAAGDRVGTAAALTSVAQIARHRGEIRRAAALAEKALEGRQGWWRANIMTVLGSIRYRQGREEEARALLTESAQLHQGFGSTTRLAQTLRYRALASLMTGDFRGTAADCDQAELIYQRIGVSRGVALTQMIRAELALYQGEDAQARALLHRAQPPSTAADEADYLLLSGRIALLTKEPSASRSLHQALRLFTENGLQLGQIEALEALAEAQPQHTASWLAAALQQREVLGAPLPQIEAQRRQRLALPSTAPLLTWQQALAQALTAV